MPRKRKNSGIRRPGGGAEKSRRTEELPAPSTKQDPSSHSSPLTDPCILHDRRVLLVEQLQLESILPGVKPLLQYTEVDNINAELSRGGRTGKLLDYLHRRVAGKSYEAFDVFMKMIAGCQPKLFETLTKRAPTEAETIFCIHEFQKEVKDCIKEKGHSTDSALDETIDLDSEHMQLTIMKDAPSSDTIDSIPHRYQSHLSKIQKNETNISALEILGSKKVGNKPQRISLYGLAGIGKSTTTQWLARQWALGRWASEFAVLFLLQIRMLAVSDCSMTAIELLTLHGLFQVTNTDHVPVLSSWLKNSTGKIIIFIDGLDEVAAFRTRLRSCPKISDLNQKAHPIDICLNILRGDLLPGCTVVSTSRPFSGLGELSFDKQVEILGLTEACVVDFVERKHPSRAEYITSYLRGNPILMSICGITFYCGLISSLLAEGVVFTNDDLKTYTRLIAFIIVQSVTRKMSEWPFVIEVGSYLPKLSNMAYMGIFGKQLKGEMSMIVFNEYDINEAELTPQELTSIQRAGLLQMKKVKTGLIHSVIAEFFHLSVQEMLASAYLLSNPPHSVNIFQQLFSNGQFNMSLLYFFGLEFDVKSPWIKNIVSSANRSQHGTRIDLLGQIDDFLENLCNRCRLRRGFTKRLQVCQLLHEGQMEDKAKLMAKDIAPDGKLDIYSTHMTIIDLMAVRFVCKYLNTLKEIFIARSHFTCTQIRFLTSSLLMDHAGTLHTLVLSFNTIGYDGAKAIGDFLKQNHSLKKLKICHDIIGEHGAVAIAEALHNNKTLQNLELSVCIINDAGAKALAEALIHNNSLQTLNICANKIEENGTKDLAEALHHNNALLEVNVAANDIGPGGARFLGQSLHHNSTLEILNVCNAHIGGDGAEALAGALLHNCTLRTLVISHNSIKDNGAIAVAKTLHHNNSLQELDVSRNGIGEDGASVLAKALHTNKTLCKLDIKFNNIGDKGWKAFAAALHNNVYLQILDLSITQIGQEGVRALATALHNKTALQSLHIRGNKIDPDGATALSEALKHNCSLKTLNMRHNPIGNSGAKAFAKALQQNTTLQALCITWCSIQEEGVTALAKALCHNNTLQMLELEYNNVGKKGVNALAKALHCNSNLQSLRLGPRRIDENDVIALARALVTNRTLQRLYINGPLLHEKGVQAVAEAMRHNSSLHTLRVRVSEKLSDDGVKALSKILKRGPSDVWM